MLVKIYVRDVDSVCVSFGAVHRTEERTSECPVSAREVKGLLEKVCRCRTLFGWFCCCMSAPLKPLLNVMKCSKAECLVLEAEYISVNIAWFLA